MAQGSMSKAEREAFVAGVHVGVLAVEEPGQAPMAVPIWYSVDSGDLVMNIHRESVKERLLQAAGRATLTVQTEDAPYQYASVEGPVRLEDGWHDPLAMATRYLGPELGQWYVNENPVDEQSVTVRLTPQRWRTFDFAKIF
jgi:PPOX class probable F420-dependent enzyme